jgi:outer membrane lipoprotein-sorting protein
LTIFGGIIYRMIDYSRPRRARSGGFMTSRCAAKVFASLPIALSFTVGLAFAQDASTTIPKSPVSPGAANQGGGSADSALRPSIDQEIVPPDNAAPVGEITPQALDEGASWEAAVDTSGAPTPLIGSEQEQAVSRINAYFNGITNMQGRFDQTDPNNKESKGRFYVQRPGKLLFDYSPPSELRILADGYSLAIEDSDLKTVEKYPIKSTPFRLLLGDTVDLGRDARIVGVERQNGTLAVSLEDSKGDAAGRIKLYFDTKPDLQLKEWVITDAQGLTTRVTVKDIVMGRRVAADFFRAKDFNQSPFGR